LPKLPIIPPNAVFYKKNPAFSAYHQPLYLYRRLESHFVAQKIEFLQFFFDKSLILQQLPAQSWCSGIPFRQRVVYQRNVTGLLPFHLFFVIFDKSSTNRQITVTIQANI